MPRTKKAENEVKETDVLKENKETKNEEVIEIKSDLISINKTVKVNTRNSVEIEDSEEIEVVSLIPNVSYKDSRTGDMYEWDEVGHSEFMTFETLKDMWRNYKGYFKNFCLKPLDDRVVIKFGLLKLYDEYSFLMDEKTYIRKNIDMINSALVKIPNNMKYSIIDRIKNFVIDGKITDVNVLRNIGQKLDTDFIAFS